MADWTDDRVETLKTLWLEGLSAAQVAQALGNVTRNAVIGKVHRLGLAARGGGGNISRPRLPRPPRLRASAVKPVVLVEEPPFVFEDGSFATPGTIESRMCRWPVGDPMGRDFHFCGRGSKPGSPYCEAHAARAHQPGRKRKAPSAPRANAVRSFSEDAFAWPGRRQAAE